MDDSRRPRLPDENGVLKPILYCPAGHKLPHRNRRGNCNVLMCVDVMNPSTRRLKSSVVKGDAHTAALVDNAAKHAQLMDMVKVPVGLVGAEAEDFVTKRLVEISPHAVGEVEYHLKYNPNDSTRLRVALEVLDRTGHGKQEKALTGGAVIVLGGGAFTVPWSQQKPVVEGHIVQGASGANAAGANAAGTTGVGSAPKPKTHFPHPPTIKRK